MDLYVYIIYIYYIHGIIKTHKENNMKITTAKTYWGFPQFRKGNKKFDSLGFECVDTTITKSLGRMKIVAVYCKEDGGIEDIERI